MVVATPASPDVIAYYFHRTIRCPSCLQIEEWAKQTIETRFSTELAAGVVAWHAVNIEKKGNEHFAKDYKLTAQSLVLVRMNPGKPGESKTLEQVWDLVGDNGRFTAYVQKEVESFLKQPSGAGKASSAPAKH